jgi:TPR repeat protein
MCIGDLKQFGLLLIVLSLVSLAGGCSKEPATQTGASAKAATKIPPNFEQTTRAAEQGDAVAQNLLGEMLLKRDGAPADTKAAADWFRKSADQGNVLAQFNLGPLFEAGQGVPFDYARAAEWYRKAAEQGLAAAQYSLAAMYVYARGVERNDAEALRWLDRAAQQGDALAQFAMGERCRTGTGVSKDLVEAYKWFTLASGQNVSDAATLLNEIKAQMNRDQIAEGRKQARQFVPKSSAASAGK